MATGTNIYACSWMMHILLIFWLCLILVYYFLIAVDLNDLYAFHYTAPDIPDKSAGWDFFDLQSEYLRMGVPNENWTLSNINKEYDVR